MRVPVSNMGLYTARRLRELKAPEVVFAHSEPVAAVVPYAVYVELAAASGQLSQETRRREQLEALLNTPELHDFERAVVLEAAHQIERWKDTDPYKTDADWFWLIGYLAGKALHNPLDAGEDAREKRLHRIITVAAAAANWHRAVSSL